MVMYWDEQGTTGTLTAVSVQPHRNGARMQIVTEFTARGEQDRQVVFLQSL